MYKAIFFDLDGTLTNPERGLRNLYSMHWRSLEFRHRSWSH